MALASGTSGGRGGKRYQTLSEINVTPLVDVMLVLLIVFMVTAPLLTVGLPVELPETRAAPIQGDREPLSITIKADGTVFLQETPIEPERLAETLKAIAQNGYDQRIFIRGDKAASHGVVVDVMARIQNAGFRRLAIVTDAPQDRPADGAR